MNKYLFFLSTITPLVLLSNTITNVCDDTNNKNTILTNKLENNHLPTISLFNNQYNYLSNSDWITNQSTTDHKFYSYDTSVLACYDFANARNTFIVNTTGNLVANPNVIVPNKDKLNIANTKQEMIDKRKVTTIKDDYNPYSKSQYSNSYFSGDNNNWQFIQQGGLEKHIDISQQENGKKVENANNLSENLGLYYIAKAEHENKINKAISKTLSNYFISQSSLKKQISNDLTTKIINLIIDNKNIYNFLNSTPMTITTKNYALNYIFNKNNDLVAISYSKWKTNDNTTNVNINHKDSYNGTRSSNHYLSDKKIIFNLWTSYAKNWSDFSKLYPTFNFDKSSNISIQSQYDKKSLSTISANTINIGTKIAEHQADSTFYLKIYHNGGFFGATVSLQTSIMIWHDEQNIYCFSELYEDSINATQGCWFSVNLNNCTFNNSMK